MLVIVGPKLARLFADVTVKGMAYVIAQAAFNQLRSIYSDPYCFEAAYDDMRHVLGMPESLRRPYFRAHWDAALAQHMPHLFSGKSDSERTVYNVRLMGGIIKTADEQNLPQLHRVILSQFSRLAPDLYQSCQGDRMNDSQQEYLGILLKIKDALGQQGEILCDSVNKIPNTQTAFNTRLRGIVESCATGGVSPN